MLNTIGLPGLLLIAIVVLVLFGRGKISSLMGEVGKGITAFKNGMDATDPHEDTPAALTGPADADTRTEALRERVLGATTLFSAQDASAALGRPAQDPAATMAAHDSSILRFVQNGKPVYPAFQFDSKRQQIYPELLTLVQMARKHGWSDHRLLHWMERPHADFGVAPAAVLEHRGGDVVAAFHRATQPELHG